MTHGRRGADTDLMFPTEVSDQFLRVLGAFVQKGEAGGGGDL